MRLERFPLIQVAGSHYEIGRQVGEACQDRINRFLDIILKVDLHARLASGARQESFVGGNGPVLSEMAQCCSRLANSRTLPQGWERCPQEERLDSTVRVNSRVERPFSLVPGCQPVQPGG